MSVKGTTKNDVVDYFTAINYCVCQKYSWDVSDMIIHRGGFRGGHWGHMPPPQKECKKLRIQILDLPAQRAADFARPAGCGPTPAPSVRGHVSQYISICEIKHNIYIYRNPKNEYVCKMSDVYRNKTFLYYLNVSV